MLFESRGGKLHQPVQVQAGVTTVIGPVEAPPTRAAAEGDGWVDVKTPVRDVDSRGRQSDRQQYGW